MKQNYTGLIIFTFARYPSLMKFPVPEYLNEDVRRSLLERHGRQKQFLLRKLFIKFYLQRKHCQPAYFIQQDYAKQKEFLFDTSRLSNSVYYYSVNLSGKVLSRGKLLLTR